MADENLGTASVTIIIDDTATDASLARLSDKIERSLDEGARDGARRMQRQLNLAIRKINPLRVEIAADTRRFRAALNNLNNLGSSEITVVPGVDPERFRRELQRRVRGIYVRIPVQPDFDGFDAAVRAHRAPDIDVRVRPNVDSRALQKGLKGIGSALGKLGGIAGATLAIGGLGIAAASTAASIGGLLAALAPIGGILAAAPAVILGAVAAFGTLKIALSGVGDAFGAALGDDAEKFEKSLEGLSPAAQSVAREVRALKPAFDNLKSTVQDRFFVKIQGDITRTAKALQGPLKSGIGQIADSWGGAALGVLGYVQGAKGVSNIRSILTASNQAVQGLSDGTNKLTAGFLQAGAAISVAFGKELEGGISDTLQDFGTFLQESAGDGRLVAWVNGALDALAQLGDLLGNIGGIISGLFSAADQGGAGFLANLQRITQTFETFVKSAQGQEAIANIFRTIATVAAQLGPIFVAIVQTLGGILPALTPLLTAIGPAITAVINALGPAISALLPGVTAVVNGIIAALGAITSSGALNQLGAAFGAVLTAVAPLLPVIGQLVASVVSALAPAIGALANALAPVISAIAGALTPILPPLVAAFQAVVTAITPLLTILGSTLGNIITALSPLLLTLATTIGTIVAAVAPLITQLVNGLAPIFEAIAPIITRLVEAITPLIVQLVNALLPVLPPIIDAFLAIIDAVVPLVEPIVALVEALAPLVALIISALAPIIQFAAEVVKWLSLNVVVPIIEAIVSVLTDIIEVVTKVITAIVTFVTDVKKFFKDLSDNVVKIVAALIVKVRDFFKNMDDQVIQTIAMFVIAIRDKFNEVKDAVTRKVAELVADAVRFFSELPGKVRSALSNFASTIASVAAEAARAFGERIGKLIADAVQRIRELPGKARSALGNLGSYLYSAGQDLIRGMINGVKAMAGNIAGAARDVVKGAVDSAKSFLGIASPSKVFKQIGIFVGQGLVRGLTASENSVKDTADKLVSLIVDAFKGKAGAKTRLDDNLIRAVRATQSELNKLVNERERLAERIAEANKFAADTAASAAAEFNLNDLFSKVREANQKLREESNKNKLNGIGGFIGVTATGEIDQLTKRLEDSAARIRRFNKQITDLAKRGLRKDLISQLIGLGPDAGADLAQQLSKASNAQIRELNAAQKQLDDAAKKFGKDSADKMFDAGEQAAKGFLAGLKGQKKDIEDLMITIARGLTRAIKTALGIKSPSRVLMAIGRNTGLGLISGIAATGRAVAGASAAMAASVVSGFGSGPALAARLGTMTEPFGASGSLGSSGSVNAAQRGAQGLSARTTSNPFGSGGNSRTVNVEQGAIVINEVGNAETTATRIMNRLVGAGALI